MPWSPSILHRPVSRTIHVPPPTRGTGRGPSRVAAVVDRRPIWFESADARLAPAAEAFGSALLVPALHARRFLWVEGDVCAAWAAGLPRLVETFADAWSLDAFGVAAMPRPCDAPRAAGTALCFSGGVDSFHTLFAWDHAADTLVYAVGYDVKLRERRRAADVTHTVRAVAAEHGSRAVIIRTNLRRHPLLRATPWARGFGGGMAALGHLLRDTVGRLVTSSDGLGAIHPETGSRPDTDPLFGSAAVDVVHAAPETTRLEKLRLLGAEPLARRHLRVCWKNVGRTLNCGACEKCLRTMVALEACGTLDRFAVFLRRGSLAAAIDTLPPPEPIVAGFYREVLAAGLPASSAAAVRRLLDRMPQSPRPAARRRSTARRRLLAAAAFAHVFTPLVGQRVGYVRPYGNVGDDLIQLAMQQLCAEFGVRWGAWSPEAAASFDVLVFGGGGNMGARYRNNYDLRTAALTTGIPLVILPQTFTSSEDRPFARVYVRERESLRLCASGILAPDLALGLAWPTPPAPTRDVGIFLRRDQERAGRKPWLARDPVRLCRTPADYLALAAAYRRIITDRLHCAIAGLHAGRDVTLVANDYHKNRSMHATWLEMLGCRFADSPAEALRQLTNPAARAA